MLFILGSLESGLPVSVTVELFSLGVSLGVASLAQNFR